MLPREGFDKKPWVVFVALLGMGYFLATGLVEAEECASSYLDTNSCETCANFAGTSWSPTTGWKWIPADKYGVGNLAGFYKCDDFSTCSGNQYSTRLCDRRDCLEDAHCPEGQTCQSGICVCDAKTCADYPGQCGNLDNGCGGTIACGCGAAEACQAGSCVGDPAGRMKIQKGGKTYSILVVPVGDPQASSVRVMIDGGEWALRKMP
ncbi:MAG: hypothetical protein GX606_03910 [Elusimicrobia bacterium]|nr:hypothetical protein [Elusimicrobiota bacterium]